VPETGARLGAGLSVAAGGRPAGRA